MRKPGKKASLSEQQAYWYDKLRKEGFQDIEDAHGNIKGNTTKRRAVDRDPADTRARRDYYIRAEHFLVERQVPFGALEAKVWSLHAGGLSYRDIAVICGVGIHTARTIVERLRAEMMETPQPPPDEP